MITGRHLTAREIAKELGVHYYLVSQALASLAGKETRIYHESGLRVIAQEVEKLRRRSKRAEPAGAYWQARASLRLLTRNATALAKVAAGIYEMLKNNPPRDDSVVTHALPHPDLTLQRPLTFRLQLVRGRLWQATLPDYPVAGNGMTQEAAAQAALKKLTEAYLSLEEDPSADPGKWHVLAQLVRRVPQAPEPEPTVVVASEAELTAEEWLDENAPEQNKYLDTAWRRGACARLYGRDPCRYREPSLIAAWDDGFAKMGRYLEAGGALACHACLRPLALA